MGQSKELNDSTGGTHRPPVSSTTSCLFLNPGHQVSQLSDNCHPLAIAKRVRNHASHMAQLLTLLGRAATG